MQDKTSPDSPASGQGAAPSAQAGASRASSTKADRPHANPHGARVPSDPSAGAETIAAVVTAPGRGGVGIVRLSGPRSLEIAGALFRSPRADFAGFKPYRLHHGRLVDPAGRPLDDVLAAFMPGPGSYTGEDVAEFHCHGAPAVLRAVLGAAVALGARHARPGEYTLRAFLNGRMDLSQAQAVAELVAAGSAEGAGLALARLDGLLGRRVRALRERLEARRADICLAVDFPEDEGECLDPGAFLAHLDEVMASLRELLEAHARARPFREGAACVLAGPVNAGKSSLLNALVGRERALVSEHAGTTRDFLEEQLDLDGLPVRLVDTAGLRDTRDPVERLGLARGLALARDSALTLLVVDGSRPLDPGLRARLPGAGRAVPDAAVQHGPDAAGADGPGPDAAGADGPGPDAPDGLGLEGLELHPARVLAVVNKADLPPPEPSSGEDPRQALERAGLTWVRVSARTGLGLDDLCREVRRRALGGAHCPDASQPAPNDRERALLALALEELQALARDVEAGLPPDLLGVRLETACGHLAGVTGEIRSEAVLNAVFDGFCIGK